MLRLHLASESAQLYAFSFTQRIPKSYKILLPWSSYTFKLLFRFMDGWLIFRYFTIACRGFKLFSANYILGLIRSLQNSVSANVLIFVLQEKVRALVRILGNKIDEIMCTLIHFPQTPAVSPFAPLLWALAYLSLIKHALESSPVWGDETQQLLT